MSTAVMLPIEIPEERIADFCERNGIARLALFGSVTRSDFGPESDIDVLVEFRPGRTPGFAFFGMGEELGEILGRRVDFLTRGFINRRYRSEVERSAVPIYVAA